MRVEITEHVFVLVCLFQNALASWWYLGLSSSYQGTVDESYYHVPVGVKCSDVPFLAPRQRELCSGEDKLLDVITEGASKGIEECQNQFQNRRWNCSVSNTTNVFGKVLNIKSRETAYIYAISSAGIMYTVTRACAAGKLENCGCDMRLRQFSPRDFQWGGCSENVKYGAKFSRDFVDTNENGGSATSLMNLWNNEAGRKAARVDMQLVCKCHGVSGSCSVKVCWRKMRTFREIGSKLKEKFDGASRVQMHQRKQKLKPMNKQQKRPTKRDLVYLEDSPDYCDYDPSSGSLGTSGRQCNRTSHGMDGCDLMCCGRGYYTLVETFEEDCDCKFFWCCRVECKQCNIVTEMHYCN